MSLIELIKERRSIRAFKPEPPPREVVLTCLEAASFAPNPSNQQPWRFIVLTGDKLTKVSSVIEENFHSAFQAKETRPMPPITEQTLNTLLKRKETELEHMLSTLSEKGADMEKLAAGNFNFHSAPVVIIFATYPWKDENLLKCTVAAMQNFMLAATALELGTCWTNAVSICQESIKKALGLSDEIVLVDGVALGYPQDNSPVNSLTRKRLPIDQLTEWL
jgi:nitroreductase